ncbi:MAG: hypothetical protein RIR01_2341 [Bacteroidota bacterium]
MQGKVLFYINDLSVILNFIIMKNFSVREMIIILNVVVIIALAGSLTALCITTNVVFVYTFVCTAPVAMLCVLILDKYEKQ